MLAKLEETPVVLFNKMFFKKMFELSLMAKTGATLTVVDYV